MGERRLPADHLRHEAVEQVRVFAQLAVLIRILAQRVDRARQRIARGVVAADDQQHQIAEEIRRVHIARGFAVRHHRQQVALRRLIDPLLPEFCEISGAFHQFGLARVLGRDDAVRTRQRGCHIGPARQFAAILPGEVEQHRKASICVVSSIETWSTQSNTSFFGRLSRHSAERLRMFIAS